MNKNTEEEMAINQISREVTRMTIEEELYFCESDRFVEKLLKIMITEGRRK